MARSTANGLGQIAAQSLPVLDIAAVPFNSATWVVLVEQITSMLSRRPTRLGYGGIDVQDPPFQRLQSLLQMWSPTLPPLRLCHFRVIQPIPIRLPSQTNPWKNTGKRSIATRRDLKLTAPKPKHAGKSQKQVMHGIKLSLSISGSRTTLSERTWNSWRSSPTSSTLHP